MNVKKKGRKAPQKIQKQLTGNLSKLNKNTLFLQYNNNMSPL